MLCVSLAHFLLIIPIWFCVPAELKEAVRTWPHTDTVSWAQRTSAVGLVKRLDQSFEKAVAALQQNDPKYYRGEINSCRQKPCGVMSGDSYQIKV